MKRMIFIVVTIILVPISILCYLFYKVMPIRFRPCTPGSLSEYLNEIVSAIKDDWQYLGRKK